MNHTHLFLDISYLLNESSEKQLDSNTNVFMGPDRTKRSNRVQVKNIQYVPAVSNGILTIKTATRTADRDHETTMQFEKVVYVKEGRPYSVPLSVGSETFYIMPMKGLGTAVKVHCSCLDFYWRFAMHNSNDDSLLGKAPAPYVKKTDRAPQNPEKVPGVCKHLKALATHLRRERLLR